MKGIIDRLAKEDGELVYDAIRAALNAHGEPISMTAVRICLEYGIGLPQKTAQEGGHSALVVRLSTPPGVDKRYLEQPALPKDAGAGPAPLKGPRPLTEALLKTAQALPNVVPDPTGDADSELEPVGDDDLGPDLTQEPMNA